VGAAQALADAELNGNETVCGHPWGGRTAAAVPLFHSCDRPGVNHLDHVTPEADELAILADQIERDRSDFDSDADARIAVIIRFGMSYYRPY
jgi:hypothetical protein